MCCCMFLYVVILYIYFSICKNVSSDLHEEESAATNTRYFEIDPKAQKIHCDIDKANHMHMQRQFAWAQGKKRQKTATATMATITTTATPHHARTTNTVFNFLLYEIRITLSKVQIHSYFIASI